MSSVISKKIKRHEYNFLLKLKDTDIIPKIYELNHKEVVMQKYDMTLIEYAEENNLKFNDLNDELVSKIDKLIDKLHSLGIFHGDLHGNNIVVNFSGDVRLIDFGESRTIKDMNECDIKYFNKFLEPFWNNKDGKNFKTVADFLEYEKYNWKLL